MLACALALVVAGGLIAALGASGAADALGGSGAGPATTRAASSADSAAASSRSSAAADSARASARRSKARLTAFGSCGQLLRYAQRNALETVAHGSLTKSFDRPMPAGAPLAQGRAVDDAKPTAEAPAFSNTNVQEAGVDEPDIVKSNGAWIFSVAGGRLRAVDVRDGTPRLRRSLSLPGDGHQLLLIGSRLLVLSQRYEPTTTAPDNGVRSPKPLADSGVESSERVVERSGRQFAQLIEIDVSNPATMRIANTLKVDGQYLNARVNGGSARVVIASSPQVSVPQGAPSLGTGPGARGGQADARTAIRRTRTSAWRPSAVIRNARTGRRARSALVRCRSVRRPAQFSGLDLLTVLTIDLSKGLTPVDSDAVMTGGETVYASPSGLYVATQRWVDDLPSEGTTPPPMSTAIHKFDISDLSETVYRGSGRVRGYLLNQWSLSEHNGFLRVASTDEPAWWGDAVRGESESFVSVLAESGGKLAQVGRVGELGRGERIYAVRFVGDVGYVVTFRQVDPLYTIDLANPSAPKVLGELKIQGYSAYLHPVGENLLLGIGQDADAAGRTIGTQLSLFDVSDLRNPVRLHQQALSSSSSEAEYDHHAFLWWPATGLAVLPLETFSPETKEGTGFRGAVGFHVERASGISQVGTVTHRTSRNRQPVRRSLVVGDRLYTVSDAGIHASRLDSLADVAWAAFE